MGGWEGEQPGGRQGGTSAEWAVSAGTPWDCHAGQAVDRGYCQRGIHQANKIGGGPQ